MYGDNHRLTLRYPPSPTRRTSYLGARLRDAARHPERKEIENPVRDGGGVIDLSAIEPPDPERQVRHLTGHDRSAVVATDMHGQIETALQARFDRRRIWVTVLYPLPLDRQSVV